MRVTQVRGKKAVNEKLKTVSERITANAYHGLNKGARTLRDAAINQLKARADLVGLSGKDSISLPENWKVIAESNKKVKLECNSPHAAAVELGTMNSPKLGSEDSKFHSLGVGNHKRAFTVGASQGGDITLSATIRPQQGFHYLETSMMNESIRSQMTKDMQAWLDKFLVRAV